MTITTLTYPTTDELVDRATRVMFHHLVANGIDASTARAATAKGGDRWLTARAAAELATITLANERAKEDATTADSAVGEDLEEVCAPYGLQRASGAGAQGAVTITCTGSVSIPAESTLTSDRTGKRYKTVSIANVSSGDPVDIIGVDTGKVTNLDAGEKLSWTSPPSGLASSCSVTSAGLVNGQDADTDARLRKRLYELLSYSQNGGSWAHYALWAENSSAAVEKAYVYPAAQGPNTLHMAITVEGTAENDYTRTATTALVTSVAATVLAEQPEFADVLLTTVAHAGLTCALKLTVPNPIAEGGPGGGWVDVTLERWPAALAGGPVSISSVVSSTSFVVNATATPVDGASIAIWSTSDYEFLSAKVVSHSGSSGSYTIVLDRALPSVIPGDYVSPALEHHDTYAATILGHVATLAPGEKVTPGTVPFARGYRHPATKDGFPSAITTRLTTDLQVAHGEISNASFFYLNGTTSITLPLEPATSAVTASPIVWRISKLAFYPA